MAATVCDVEAPPPLAAVSIEPLSIEPPMPATSDAPVRSSASRPALRGACAAGILASSVVLLVTTLVVHTSGDARGAIGHLLPYLGNANLYQAWSNKRPRLMTEAEQKAEYDQLGLSLEQPIIAEVARHRTSRTGSVVDLDFHPQFTFPRSFARPLQMEPRRFAPPYKRGDRLGVGGFGVVSRIADDGDSMRAIKEFNALDHAEVDREFKSELRVRQRLGGATFANTALLEAFEWYSDGEHLQTPDQDEGSVASLPSYAVVMPFYPGGSMVKALSKFRNGYIDIKETMGQLALGLRELHRRGIIHRDFKNENVVASDERQSRWHIIDYGLSQVCPEGERPCHSKSTSGTPRYMPCTVAQGDIYGVEVDWYAWAMQVLYVYLGDSFNPAFTQNDRLMHKPRSDDEVCLREDTVMYWSSAKREHLLTKRLERTTRIPGEVKDLLLSILGRRFENELSSDATRMQMEDGSVSAHPVLGHRAWLLDSWVVDPLPRGKQEGESAVLKRPLSEGKARLALKDPRKVKLDTFWEDLCEKYTDNGVTCADVLSAGHLSDESTLPSDRSDGSYLPSDRSEGSTDADEYAHFGTPQLEDLTDLASIAF